MTVFRYYRPHCPHDGENDMKKTPLPGWLKEVLSAPLGSTRPGR